MTKQSDTNHPYFKMELLLSIIILGIINCNLVNMEGVRNETY